MTLLNLSQSIMLIIRSILIMTIFSKIDRGFLELMERESIKIDGYYELPLLLKDKELVLPNNRMAAIKRMQSLKKRFERDELF